MSNGVAYHALVGWGNVEWPEYVRVYHAADTSCRKHLPAYENYIQERTCSMSYDWEDEDWCCSECDSFTPGVVKPLYCSRCGAKVVE